MKIAMLISGGVDSSVALHLLKEQGHDITAYYLKIWLEDELAFLGDCPWQEDLEYVRQVCEQADVPLKVVSLQREYFDKVVSYTVNEVKHGRTPNPDVMCNNHIKFGLFFEKLDEEYDKVASGHYAQIEERDGHYFLKQSPDEVKDQTYFLAHLSQEQLSKIIFPIGHLEKSEVRDLAEKYDLANKDRKDSQGICFLGKVKFTDFIKHYLGEKPGDILEFESDEKLGEHEGFYYYTIGQRRGIKLAGGPWFVVKKDIEKNIIYVSKNYYTGDKKRDHFTISQPNWFAGHAPTSKELRVKVRHGAETYDCTLDGDQVQLAQSDQGLASGQFAVFYEGDLCLGSAIIESPED